MKTRIFSILSIIALCFIASCQPTEDRVPLKNSYNPEQPLDIQVTQTGNKGNGITLKVLTPGVFGEWQYGVGSKKSDEVSFIYIATGEATFTFNVFNSVFTQGPNGIFEVQRGFKQEVKVQVDEIDQPLPERYALLCGDDLSAGKNWVLNGTNSDGGLWWYMCPAGNPAKWQEAWWNAGGTGAAPADASGSMNFNLNGGANYSKTNAGTTTSGSFAFSPDYSKITISGADILGFDPIRVSPNNEYTIIELTKDKLVLYASNNGGGTGWVWVFRPQ